MEQLMVSQRKRWRPRLNINSPYLLLLAPILIAGFYLVLNPGLLVIAINHPYAAACILSIPVCLVLIKLILNFFSVIEQWIRLQFEKARQSTRNYFFEFVVLVFMLVSILEAGPFFAMIQHQALGGFLGYLTVFAFDLIAVQCMRARRTAVSRGNDRKAFIYMAGVWFCALVSMFANGFSSVSGFTTPLHSTALPGWMSDAAPWLGVVFPVMIIFLSYTSDADEELDVAEKYREEQERRIKFLQTQHDMMRQSVQLVSQIDAIKQREFFLKSWLFTRKKVALVIETVTQQVRATLTPELQQMRQVTAQQEQTLRGALQRIDEQEKILTHHHETVASLFEEIARLKTQLDAQQMRAKNAPLFATEYATTGKENARETETDGYPVVPSFGAPLSATNVTFLREKERAKNAPESATKNATRNGRQTAAQKAAVIIKKEPEIAPKDLARRAKMSEAYARKLLAQYAPLSETV